MGSRFISKWRFGLLLLIIAQINPAFSRAGELERFQQKCLAVASDRTDSIVAAGMVGDYDQFLVHKLGRAKLDQFYASLSGPKDYFPYLKQRIGWDFKKTFMNFYKYNVKRAGKISAAGAEWASQESRHFVIYYQRGLYDSTAMEVLPDYLEKSFSDIKAQLFVDNAADTVLNLLIRTFYPDSSRPYYMPSDPELTDGKIQVILFPNQAEMKSRFPYDRVNDGIGGWCTFTLYHRPDGYSKTIHPRVDIVMNYLGYTSFPLINHELAHAVYFLYYTDYDSLQRNIGRLNRVLRDSGREVYRTQFWNIAKDIMPGKSGILEEAIAYRAMLTVGPLGEMGFAPPISSLLSCNLDYNFDLLSTSADGNINFGNWTILLAILRLSHAPQRKVVNTVYAWSDFLGFMGGRYPRHCMTSFYDIKSDSLSRPFESIFGVRIKDAEMEWVKQVKETK